MRVTTISLVGLLLLMVTSTAFAAGGIPWVYDLGEAQQMAQRDRRLLLLHFYADWCGPCRNLEQSVFPDANVSRALAASYVPVKINVDRNQELAKRYGVSQIPTDVIADSQGRVLHQTSSPSNPVQYVQLLNGLAANFAAVPPIHAVSTQVPRPEDQAQTPPSQNAWDSPWLPQDRQSDAPDSYRPRLPAADASDGSTAPQDPSYDVAPLISQAGSTAGRKSTWQPDATDSRWQGGAVGATGPQPPTSPSLPSTGSTQVNPYVSASPGSGSPASSAPQAADGSRETWGQIPNAPKTNTAQERSPQWNQQSTAPPSPSGGGFRNPYAQPSTPPTAPPATPNVSSGPPLALDGYCPVTLAEEEKWAKGDRAWGALHRGRTYLFRDQEQQQRFLADPDRYSPVLSGYDPIRYVDAGEPIPGLRQHGMWFRGKIYLFADEGSLDQFSRNPEHYAQRSHEIMMAAGR